MCMERNAASEYDYIAQGSCKSYYLVNSVYMHGIMRLYRIEYSSFYYDYHILDIKPMHACAAGDGVLHGISAYSYLDKAWW